MIQNAIKKLRTEMEKNANNTYIKMVGGTILKHLEENPNIADKIMDKDKTITKSLDAVRKVAEKKKVGNCAVMEDQECYEIVFKYFGIEVATAKAPALAAPKPAAVPEKKNIEFNVSLDELL